MSNLDDELSKLFHSVYNSLPSEHQIKFKDSQRLWIKERDTKCQENIDDVAKCTKNAYENRIAVIYQEFLCNHHCEAGKSLDRLAVNLKKLEELYQKAKDSFNDDKHGYLSTKNRKNKYIELLEDKKTSFHGYLEITCRIPYEILGGTSEGGRIADCKNRIIENEIQWYTDLINNPQAM